ncbi:DUF1127 domain-containing protein [Roseibium sediminis]|uniref:DUF1127 domain-containing protein n=1 Tax=Roseibium sediminis TaxID=1775174 RepID=UPI00123CEECF|nr:DUF1127 domain-containing protein [Roseibium sediminis]
MSAFQTASFADFVFNSVSSLGRSVRRAAENYGKARAAAALYEHMSALSDEQLADMGLQRDHVARTVFRRVFDDREA